MNNKYISGKVVFPLAALVLSVTLLFSACGEDDPEKTDKSRPSADNVSLNWGDTIHYQGRVIRINIDTLRNLANRTDTLVIGKYIKLSAHMQDDQALSSFQIDVRRDDQIPADGVLPHDTCYNVIRNYSTIFRMKDSTFVKTNVALIPDSIRRATTGAIFPIREGEYDFKLNVLDMVGKDTTVHRKVILLYRKTIAEG